MTKENKLIPYTVWYKYNNGANRYQNIQAENVEQARDVFDAGLKGMIKTLLYKTMTQSQRDDEFKKFKVVTISEILPKKEKKNVNSKS